MTIPHAVAFIDHHTAQILQFTADDVVQRKVHEHLKFTRQHGSSVRTEHEFFGQVCDALDSIAEVLVVGGHTALAGFRHFADKHRPQTAKRIVGYDVVDHPSDKQLVALGRKHFGLDDEAGAPGTHPKPT